MKLILAKRNEHLSEFCIRNNPVALTALTGLFFTGAYLTMMLAPLLLLAYAGLWVLSYMVLYFGTCRYCAYYGKSCPVPLEGSLVNRVVKRSTKPFGWMAIGYAFFAYMLRIAVPVAAIVKRQLYIEGAIFGVFFLAFWIAHLLVSGCPNCVNYGCPLNPGAENRNGITS